MLEVNNLIRNKIFIEVAQILNKKKVIRARWVFIRKIDRLYKVRLIIRKFKQRYKIYYIKIYALVINLATIRVLFIIAAYFDFYIY